MSLNRYKLILSHDHLQDCSLSPTAYVVRREGYVLTRVCLSVHTGGEGGLPRPGPGRYPSQVQPGGGDTPPRVPPPPSDLAGRYPDPGGVPHLRYPPSQTWLGGTPPQVPPPGQTWLGGYPDRGGTPPRVVLDTQRSVCLLRSRRRTFLLSRITVVDVNV